MKYLVIVESPAKCKKIQTYLEMASQIVFPNEFRSYEVVATMGHIRELRDLSDVISKKGEIRPKFHVMKDKKKVVDALKTKMTPSTRVLLAQDDDREGEAIAYHVSVVLGLDMTSTKRLVFHEITPQAIRVALETLRPIHFPTVESAITRQLLDLLVGFKVSPTLWKYIGQTQQPSLSAGRCQTQVQQPSPSLSAGRCQSVALKMVVEKDDEIRAATPKRVWTVTGFFTQLNLPFTLSLDLESKEETRAFLEASKPETGHRHILSLSPIQTGIERTPPQPFTTSSLQQRASNLGFAPKETMRVCQSLYEAGYITYMRTDSTALSQDFRQETHTYIEKTWGAAYVPTSEASISTKASEASVSSVSTSEGPHEAIRPTKITTKVPDSVVDVREKRMYRLIWETTVQSCMTPAKISTLTATIPAPHANANERKYTYKAERIDFLGWRIVKESDPDPEEGTSTGAGVGEAGAFELLRSLKNGSELPYTRIQAKVTLHGTKGHYSEANVVRELEKRGIGRPSTYASIVDKLLDRNYVTKQNIEGTKVACVDFVLNGGGVLNGSGAIQESMVERTMGAEKNKLVLQPIGRKVMEFLDLYFSELFQYGFTATMEQTLDELATATATTAAADLSSTFPLVIEYNHRLTDMMAPLTAAFPERKIDEEHKLVYARHGAVVERTAADGTKSFLPVGDIQGTELASIVKCTERTLTLSGSGEKVCLKSGRYGIYIETSSGKKISMSSSLVRPLENVTEEEVSAFLRSAAETKATEDPKLVRVVSDHVSIRIGPKGDYIFYKKPTMKKPVFYSLRGAPKEYKTCDIEVLRAWIRDTHSVV